MPTKSPDTDGRIDMDLLRSASPTVSTSSSLDSNGLPHCRIHCNKSQIHVGTQKFASATDALVAYLNQFDLNEGPSPVVSLQSPNPDNNSKTSSEHPTASVNGEEKAEKVQVSDKGIVGSGLVMGPNGILRLENNKEDVENLLTSKVSPELKEEVTDTLREVKLRHLLKKAAIKSQKQTKTGLQQEVEAALARSAKLLEKVTREDLPSSKAVISDISNVSLSTQVLLAGGSGSSDDSALSLDSFDLKERDNGYLHLYQPSHLKAAQHAPSSSIPPTAAHRHSRLRERRGSIDSLLPPHDLNASQLKTESGGSSNSVSNNSDPSDIIRRIRSRSVPPRLYKERTQSLAPDWLTQLDHSVSKSVPSWVKNMSPCEISDSLWLQSVPPQKSTIPSWIYQVDKSDISIDVSGVESLLGSVSMTSLSSKAAATIPKVSSISPRGNELNTREELRPELNSTVLSPSLSPSLNSAKHVTFGDSEVLADPVNPIHSTPIISRSPKKSVEIYSIRSLSPSKVLDIEYKGEAYLRNNILPQTARLKKSMEKFASSTENLRKSPSSNSSDGSSDYKCSSIDTFALLTGKVSKANIRTEKKIGNRGNGIFPDSLCISSILPEGSQGHLSNGHSSSDGLDGDRPWEAMTNTFKPPVHVGRDGDASLLNSPLVDTELHKRLSSTSLSGGNQPGSMEALKNMLFKLQAEEKCVQETNNANNETQSPSVPALIPALEDYNFQMEPGGHSLEKALLHLNRLKTLVKNTSISSKTNMDQSVTENGDHENEKL